MASRSTLRVIGQRSRFSAWSKLDETKSYPCRKTPTGLPKKVTKCMCPIWLPNKHRVEIAQINSQVSEITCLFVVRSVREVLNTIYGDSLLMRCQLRFHSITYFKVVHIFIAFGQGELKRGSLSANFKLVQTLIFFTVGYVSCNRQIVTPLCKSQ